MSIESSSDRPENLPGSTQRPEYTGALPDLTIGDKGTRTSANTSATDRNPGDWQQSLEEPAVVSRDIGADQAVSAHVSRATRDIGRAAADDVTVEVPEPSVTSRNRPEDGNADPTDVSHVGASDDRLGPFRLYTEEIIEEEGPAPAASDIYYYNGDTPTNAKSEPAENDSEESAAQNTQYPQAASDDVPPDNDSSSTHQDAPATIPLGTKSDEDQRVFDEYVVRGLDQAAQLTPPTESSPEPPTLDAVREEIDRTISQTYAEPVSDTASRMPLGGLLEHDIAPTDDVQTANKVHIPTDVVAEPATQAAQEASEKTTPPPATDVELLDTTLMDIPEEIREAMRAPVTDFEPVTREQPVGDAPEVNLQPNVRGATRRDVFDEPLDIGITGVRSEAAEMQTDTSEAIENSSVTDNQSDGTIPTNPDETSSVGADEESTALLQRTTAETDTPTRATETAETDGVSPTPSVGEAEPTTQEGIVTDSPVAGPEAPTQATGDHVSEPGIDPSAALSDGKTHPAPSQDEGVPRHIPTTATSSATGSFPTDPGASQPGPQGPTQTPIYPGADPLDSPLFASDQGTEWTRATDASEDSREYPSFEEGRFERAWRTFNGIGKPKREDATDGILDPNEIYSYARPTPRERVAAAGVLVGTAAISPIRAALAKVDGVERTGLGRYTVKITRRGRTKFVEVAAPGAGVAKIMARIKSAFS